MDIVTRSRVRGMRRRHHLGVGALRRFLLTLRARTRFAVLAAIGAGALLSIATPAAAATTVSASIIVDTQAVTGAARAIVDLERPDLEPIAATAAVDGAPATLATTPFGQTLSIPAAPGTRTVTITGADPVVRVSIAYVDASGVVLGQSSVRLNLSATPPAPVVPPAPVLPATPAAPALIVADAPSTPNALAGTGGVLLGSAGVLLAAVAIAGGVVLVARKRAQA